MSRSQRPWDNPDFFDEDDNDDWMGELDPSEFIFAVVDNEGEGPVVYICPKRYWDDEGHLWDGELGLDDILPDGLHEVMDATFMDAEGRDADELRDVLEQAGFIPNNAFQNFMAKTQ